VNSAPPRAPVSARRIDSIDVLRGLVMALMAIDHARDFFTNARIDPLDLQRTWPALFLTRWVTHLCAPVFLFLAGTGTALSMARGRSTAEIARFLLTRGAWLILLELTLVRFGWLFNFDVLNASALVIWAIGWSMVALAALVFLPVRYVGVFGVAMIVLHNALDPVEPGDLGRAAWLWTILHEGGEVPVPGRAELFVGYPLVPWIGVMAAGYAFGALIQVVETARRATLFARLGFGLIVAFVALRATNLYGDPRPWAPQESTLFTLFSFIDCDKYPPSLLYLLITLGLSFVLLAAFERWPPLRFKPLVVFGRVPLFFYLLHLPLLHLMAVQLELARGHGVSWLFQNPHPPVGSLLFPPEGYGYGLPVVYALWATALVILYFPCRAFAALKERRRERWLSYL
jgi:uncharacterized membrane protein